jgi:hypothetical protein
MEDQSFLSPSHAVCKGELLVPLHKLQVLLCSLSIVHLSFQAHLGAFIL